MDYVGRYATFQHVNDVPDSWNGVVVFIEEKYPDRYYRVSAMLAHQHTFGVEQTITIDHLALREELTIIEEVLP